MREPGMRNRSQSESDTGFETGTGNLFADIGIPEPEIALAKARLADLVGDAIEALGITQVQAGEVLGIDQGTVSKLINGRLDGFSQERLIRYLTVLGRDVEILVRPAAEPKGPGRVRVGTG